MVAGRVSRVLKKSRFFYSMPIKEGQSTGKALEIKKNLVNNNNKIVIKTNNTGNQPTIIKTFL